MRNYFTDNTIHQMPQIPGKRCFYAKTLSKLACNSLNQTTFAGQRTNSLSRQQRIFLVNPSQRRMKIHLSGFPQLLVQRFGTVTLISQRPAGTASYSVSVRQVAALLHASLEPCLTTTLLRFANTSPPSGCVEDFHLQIVKHARHTQRTG